MKNNKLNITLIVLSILVFLILFFGKDKLNCIVANYQLRNNNTIVNKSDSSLFFNKFNNSLNNYNFELSLVQLGGVGCKPCMKMDTVLVDIKTIYSEKINIKTYKVTNEKGKVIAKYFGVNAIPTQIIFNKTGTEIFRHTGFISKEELSEKVNSAIINQQ